MGFQSGLLAATGSVIGAVGSIKKTLKERQNEQTAKVAEIQEAKKTQKRNFMDYLKNLEVQGGGTVGQLPPKVQESIAKQYSTSEKEKLMDTIDKEKTNGK